MPRKRTRLLGELKAEAALRFQSFGDLFEHLVGTESGKNRNSVDDRRVHLVGNLGRRNDEIEIIGDLGNAAHVALIVIEIDSVLLAVLDDLLFNDRRRRDARCAHEQNLLFSHGESPF